MPYRICMRRLIKHENFIISIARRHSQNLIPVFAYLIYGNYILYVGIAFKNVLIFRFNYPIKFYVGEFCFYTFTQSLRKHYVAKRSYQDRSEEHTSELQSQSNL